MSKLEELEEELYGREGEEEVKRRMREPRYGEGETQKPASFWSFGAQKKKVPRTRIERVILRVFIALVFIAVAASAAFFLFFYLGSQGQEVKITIHNAGRVELGADFIIPISIKNVSRSKLSDVEFSIELPRGTRIIEGGVERAVLSRVTERLDDFAPGEERVRDIRVRMFGKEGEGKKIEAALLYRPEGIGARFSSKQIEAFVIERTPFALSWSAPDTLSSGQEVLLSFRFSSNADIPFENISFRFEPSSGFSFISSIPAPDVSESIWHIGALDPGKEYEIAIQGRVSGESGEVKVFRGELGVFNALTKEWTPYSESVKTAEIEVSPLSVTAFLNGSRIRDIEPGEALIYTLRYKNNSTFSMQNVTVRARLDEGAEARQERLLEFSSLSAGESGVFDERIRSVVWGPASNSMLKEIKSGEGGEFTFRINTKSRPIVRTSQDTNFVVTLTSSIEAATIPQKFQGLDVSSEDILESRVASQVLFRGRAVFRASPFNNSGPLPPRVGVKTTYTLILEARNFTNDMSDVKVVIPLPQNVSWENTFSPRDATIAFQAASREIHWNLGTLSAGTGVIRPSANAAIQVSILPSEVDVGKPILLAGEARLSGRDTFTNRDIVKTAGSLTTELREDTPAVSGEWEVVR